MTNDRAYDVRGLAERWQCSTDAIYALIAAGSLRTFKIGKRGLRVAAKEVERWERDRESESQSTSQETARSAGAAKRQWPSSAIRALAGVKG